MSKSTLLNGTIYAVVGAAVGTLAATFMSSDQVNHVSTWADTAGVFVACLGSAIAAFAGALAHAKSNATATPPTPSNNGQSLN